MSDAKISADLLLLLQFGHEISTNFEPLQKKTPDHAEVSAIPIFPNSIGNAEGEKPLRSVRASLVKSA
ncbi:MAG: hypothetical protein NVSMB56_02240 [Pyrinomonadaceae bacterium]